MNITTLNHMNRDQADDLTRELQQILALGKTFREKKLLTPRFLDIAFLLAAEQSLQPRVFYSEKQLKKMLEEKERIKSQLIKSEGVIDHIKNIVSQHSNTDEALLWIQGPNQFYPKQDKKLGILFNCQGYIVGYSTINASGEQECPEEIYQVGKGSNNMIVRCSVMDDVTFQASMRNKTSCIPNYSEEVYIHFGYGRYPAKETKKFYVISHFEDRQCPQDLVLNLMSDLHHSQHWFIRRLRSLLKENSMDVKALLELWVLTHTFYKLISMSAKKYNISSFDNH